MKQTRNMEEIRTTFWHCPCCSCKFLPLILNRIQLSSLIGALKMLSIYFSRLTTLAGPDGLTKLIAGRCKNGGRFQTAGFSGTKVLKWSCWRVESRFWRILQDYCRWCKALTIRGKYTAWYRFVAGRNVSGETCHYLIRNFAWRN